MAQAPTSINTNEKLDPKAEVAFLIGQMNQMREQMARDNQEIAELRRQTRESLDRTFEILEVRS